MTISTLVLVPAKFIEASQTEQYAVSNPQATTVVDIIDKATVTNSGTVAAEFSCNLVTNNDVVSDANLIIDAHRIEPGETYECPELVGQALNEGDFISTLASAASTLVLRISGREITT